MDRNAESGDTLAASRRIHQRLMTAHPEIFGSPNMIWKALTF
jgi:hypothetical protein